MKKTLFLILAFAILLSGCGGGSRKSIITPPPPPPTGGGNPPPPPAPSMAWNALGGFGATGGTVTRTSSLTGALPGPLKYMAAWFPFRFQQQTQISLSGSYQGFCYQLPANYSGSVSIYGLGAWVSSDCASNTVSGGAPDGVPVIGDGQITAMVVTARGAGASDNSGTVTVYDNGKPTAMTVTLGVSPYGPHINQTPINVANGDQITAAIALVPGDNYGVLRVILIKQ